MNLVVLCGNLTKDPDLRVSSNGTKVCKFGLAVNKVVAGNKKTMFIDCTCFKGVAEAVSKYKKKGDQILLKGEIELQEWDGKDGKRHRKHEIIAHEVKFVGARKAGSGDAPESDPGGGDDGFSGGQSSNELEEIPF